MKRTWKWLPSLGVSALLAANSFTAAQYSPTTVREQPARPADTVLNAEEQKQRVLLDKLTELSGLIERSSQSPQLWQLHLEQSRVLLQIAVQSPDKERDNIVRMAVDANYSAALLCPREQSLALQELQQLPQRLAQAFPGNPVILYAVLQEIQAETSRILEESGGDRVKSEEHRCRRLMQFAHAYPEAAETPKAVLQAAQTHESLGQTEEASRCYQYLVDHFPSAAAARKAAGAIWRLGQNHEVIQLELPLLYAASNSSRKQFNLEDLRGNVVIVYFWTSSSERAAEDFQTLKQLTDRYAGRGLEVVYVNMDSDPASARAFLAGRLTAGVHCYQAGGLDGPVAERYGLQEVPQAFLIGKDGALVKHSLPVSRLETELTGGSHRGH